MRIGLFYHSLLSDWNHGNAHFLRGIVSELLARGHDVRVFEPFDAWSVEQLLADAGPEALEAFRRRFPELRSRRYVVDELLAEGERGEPEKTAEGDRCSPGNRLYGEALEAAVDGCDLVLVHEWNDPRLVAALGRLRVCEGGFALLFHDTHHRSVTDPRAMAALDLSGYDGVLAFGEVVRQRYLDQRWARRAWTWHEAADVRRFHPLEPHGGPAEDRELGGEGGDVVWIGNWGDDERSDELHRFLLGPVSRLGLKAAVHGVRYPEHARAALARHGLDYRGWLPNFEVPRVFARFKATVHVPRRPYAEALPGIPTIRPFEALACGIPLVSAPWRDAEGLFRPGTDFLVAEDGAAMERHLRNLVHDAGLRRELARNGLETILARHTCRHRVDELMAIATALGVGREARAVAPRESAESPAATPAASRSENPTHHHEVPA